MLEQVPPDKLWTPTFWTPPTDAYDLSDGLDVADFSRSFMRVLKGRMVGQPLQLRRWQSWLVLMLLARNRAGRRIFRRALVGIARKNGKSVLGSALALHGLYDGEPGSEVYSAAGDRQQARIVFNEAKQQVRNSPSLSKVLKVYRDVIEFPSKNSIYRVLSADGKLAQGLNPSLVIFDEVHVQPSDDLWDALTLGSGTRDDPLVVGITTAGDDLEDSLLGRLYRYGRDVASGAVDDSTFGMFWWESAVEALITEIETWLQSNPNLAEGIIDPDDFASAEKSTTEAAFRRYRLNQWVRPEGSWLRPGLWEQLRHADVELVDGELTYVGLDFAQRYDSAAVVAVQGEIVEPADDEIDVDEIDELLDDDGLEAEVELEVRRVGVASPVTAVARVWENDGGAVIDYAEVMEHLRDLHRRFKLGAVFYDPAFFELAAQTLFDEGLPMVAIPQSNSRMVPYCQDAYRRLNVAAVRHDFGGVASSQVQAAQLRFAGEGWRLSKGKSKSKIDTAIALVLAVAAFTSGIGADDLSEAVW